MMAKMSPGYVDAVAIPNELVVEILSRVPVKDIMRFRCVSKFWNSLPFDPTFIKLHLLRSPRDTPILFSFSKVINGVTSSKYYSSSAERLIENPLSPNTNNSGVTRVPLKRKYAPIGVCNGLVCLKATNQETVWVRFWNPATRFRSEKSPLLETLSGNFKIGFGYDESTETYKVVVVVYGDRGIRKLQINAYSLGDYSWRNIELVSSDTHSEFPIDILQHKGEFLNGTLNWVAEIGNSNQYVIFSFDVKNETYKCLTLPDDVRFGDGRRFTELGVFRSHICVSHIQDRTHYTIWQMNKFGDEKSWTQLVKISFDLFLFSRRVFPHPLCISSDGDVLLQVNDRYFQLVQYNRRDNTTRHIVTPYKIVTLNSADYVQSLVLPYRN